MSISRGRRFAALTLAVAVFASAAAAARTASTESLTSAGFAVARAPYAYAFPRDHASHPAYQTEWWYFTGHLRAQDGRRFGYELTFFRVGLRPGDPTPAPGQSRWRGNELFPAHLALSDVDGGRFVHVERFAREALGMGSAATDRLAVRAESWTLDGAPVPGHPALEAMRLHARDGGLSLDLAQVPEKPPAVHGTDGVSRKAGCATCASHYYSYTRVRTRGTLVYRGARLRVDGTSWMDHEFGSSELQKDQAGWDWFALQLDDGRELMLYRLREKDGSVTPQSAGSLVERDGRVRPLALRDIAIDATGRWQSPHDGAVYPSGWHVRVPLAGLDVTLVPQLADQELASLTGGLSYWEGAVDVRDSGMHRALGLGYVELTGYVGTVAL